MSAIWGNISFDTEIDQSGCRNMRVLYETNCKLDHIYEYYDRKIYFGCGIQEIIRESVNEKMPIAEDKNAIIFEADCIIDNREEIKQELGYSKEDIVPDGRLLYELYLKEKINFLTKIRGMYAIAIYDKNDDTLYLISDPISSRCLYYYRGTDGGICFSTLIRPITEFYKDIPFNSNYIKDFLVAPGLMPNITSDETPHKGIYKLNPGTYLVVTRESVEEREYFDIDKYIICNDYTNADVVSDTFKKLYAECVKDAVYTSGEVASSMSSGLDSATTSILAAQILDKKSKKLFSYTYVPENKMKNKGNKILDETVDVQKILDKYPNMKGHFVNNNGKCCIDDMNKVLEIMEIPIKAYVNFPNLCEIYEKAHKHGCKIVLTGQNGNSTVSHGYIDDVLCDLYIKKKYITFLRYLNSYCKTVKESRKAALKGCIRYFRHTKKVLSIAGKRKFEYEIDNRFISQNIMNDYPLEIRFVDNDITYIDNIPTIESEYKRFIKHQALYTYLGEFETKMGLKYGIALRDPTADIRMISFCYHMPYRYFAYNGVPRWLIRSSFTREIPNEILNNWMRYGVQNADCYTRLRRDWKRLVVDINKQMQAVESDKRLCEYFNFEKINSFLSDNQKELNLKDEAAIDQLMYIYCVSKFYQLCKKS